jgi:excisionase family DNA binding protein
MAEAVRRYLEQEGNLGLVEAAARLGVSPYTLRRWSVYDHKLSYLKVGRRILFPVSSLVKFEGECRVPARAETSGR